MLFFSLRKRYISTKNNYAVIALEESCDMNTFMLLALGINIKGQIEPLGV